ncbi:hypothetical protein M427DRAFT_67300 [Gonapodya prolifera JEL478]|uniref:Endonuclease/exonuclease/phosphatase domain-containing protein n=1 Tax=Gonapodya prolifera (strain JEL478) TaxID=1344416 RepID=A0A139AQX3_GONPJ|nr:hypothetical protein M427DRAFT_67300 [Gonapodya prolifera JEL478]|eukprot:KXS19161.1 hypothetical protein M427DRAFT_67300 [Gonapodya prolifera JEL478]
MSSPPVPLLSLDAFPALSSLRATSVVAAVAQPRLNSNRDSSTAARPSPQIVANSVASAPQNDKPRKAPKTPKNSQSTIQRQSSSDAVPRPVYPQTPPPPPPIPRRLLPLPPFGPLQPLPPPIPLLDRSDSHELSPPSTKFTVASYNVLAQCLVRRDFYPWASREALKVKHRHTSLLAHLSHLQPSILCLQESDRFASLSTDLTRLGYECERAEKESIRGSRMDAEGTGHGVVVAWRKERFRLLQHRAIPLDNHPLASPTPLTPRTGNVAQIAFLALSLPPSSTSSSQPNEVGLIVTNSHLFWRPQAIYERLRQGWVLCEEARKARLEAVRNWPELGRGGWPVLMCGDFNTLPTDSLYAVLTGRPITPELISRLQPVEEAWTGYGATGFGGGKEKVGGDDENGNETSVSKDSLAGETRAGGSTSPTEDDTPASAQPNSPVTRAPNPHPVTYILQRLRRPGMPRLVSTHSRYTALFGRGNRDPKWDRDPSAGWDGEPPWTTYAGWSGTLDYVFVGYAGERGMWREGDEGCSAQDPGEGESEGNEEGEPTREAVVSVTGLLELPPVETVRGGIPNDVYPSDHVPVMCEVGWWAG